MKRAYRYEEVWLDGVPFRVGMDGQRDRFAVYLVRRDGSVRRVKDNPELQARVVEAGWQSWEKRTGQQRPEFARPKSPA